MTETTDSALPDVADQAGMSVNIYIPDTTTQANPIYSYFRIGMASPEPETTLPPDVTAPGTPGTASTFAANPFPEGGLLYTTGTVTITAPTTNIVSPSVIVDTTNLVNAINPPPSTGISTFAPTTLTAVVNGSDLCSASMTTNGDWGIGGRAANVTFQNTDQLTMTEGLSTNYLTGDALTFWTGNDQSIGFGGLLWANIGVTSNLFGGMIVNCTNQACEVQGLGEYKITTKYGVTTPDSITLKIAPTTAATVASAATVTAFLNAVMGLGTLAAAAYSAEVLTKLNQVDTGNADALKSRMKTTNSDLDTLTMLIVGVQALSVILGVVLQFKRPADGATATSQLSLADESALMAVGPNAVTIGPVLISLAADDLLSSVSVTATDGVAITGTNTIGLTCGAASIAMTPATLSLTAGPSSIVLGPNGITINGLQIVNNALQAGFAPVVLPPPLPNPQALAINAQGQLQGDVLIVNALDD